ncbi:MAG TPA: LytTR family transcriptional regulator DNA-binding domain-containing protein [Candidatus Pullichristensenella excrementigallinarum]|uniref:LytTR family transcriptional regulator DNA-binding domain-containing protein n=1 Tax=Candidatus Pullichristensenella excrementigallinarum TaxID=2840907 RepID=A0A9D1IE20_9FIRM|nr:LytTR family transcriptional regulator DNA-binding domain-containing protein [Candidatus Pullichristensenella excrementigallinarum]
MARKNYTENDAVSVSQAMLRAHHDRRIGDCIRYFAEDMIWTGPFEFQRSRGIREFIQAAASEYDTSPITLSREEYHPLRLAPNLFMVYGRYFCTMYPEGGGIITSYPRFTLMLRGEENGLKVFYMHVSIAGDRDSAQGTAPTMGYYEYIGNFLSRKKQGTGAEQAKKKALHDINGNYHYLFDYELVRVQGERVYCRFFTHSESFLARMSLLAAEELLGDGFCRIHKSHLVNLMYVRSAKGQTLTMTDGTVLPVSRTLQAEIRKKCEG